MLAGLPTSTTQLFEKELDLDPELMTCNVACNAAPALLVYHAKAITDVCQCPKNGIGGVFMFENV